MKNLVILKLFIEIKENGYMRAPRPNTDLAKVVRDLRDADMIQTVVGGGYMFTQRGEFYMHHVLTLPFPSNAFHIPEIAP